MPRCTRRPVGLRRSAIVLRRYMVPQREALSTFEIEDLGWLSDRDRLRLREATDRITRVGEELDAISDRAQIVHEQIMDHRAERRTSRPCCCCRGGFSCRWAC